MTPKIMSFMAHQQYCNLLHALGKERIANMIKAAIRQQYLEH